MPRIAQASKTLEPQAFIFYRIWNARTVVIEKSAAIPVPGKASRTQTIKNVRIITAADAPPLRPPGVTLVLRFLRPYPMTVFRNCRLHLPSETAHDHHDYFRKPAAKICLIIALSGFFPDLPRWYGAEGDFSPFTNIKIHPLRGSTSS